MQIFTQPMKTVRDLREYEKRCDFGPHASVEGAHHTWYVGTTPAGFVVGYRF